MTLETILVETNPGQKKLIKIDSTLQGASSPTSNFQELIQPYTLKNGTKIMGTKAVIINSTGFLKEFSEKYELNETTTDAISKKISSGIYKQDDSGYSSYFWNNTKEVHHRDIMNNYFTNFSNKLKELYDEQLTKAYLNEEEFDKAVKIENSLNELNKATTQLYETKKGAKHELNDAGKLILNYSQGYQLSSIDASENEDLGSSKICKLELSSGITKDQEKYNIKIPESETSSNLNYFLNHLEHVDFKTSSITIPKNLGNICDEFTVTSTPTHKQSNGNYVTQTTTTKLKVKYV